MQNMALVSSSCTIFVPGEGFEIFDHMPTFMFFTDIAGHLGVLKYALFKHICLSN